ncbi:MAG: 4-alpha-glucanotransferase [Lachnospiraceae bacterium]|nr:4-alpha-glucanotransferase [Lachnospiraceae bacterium]
MKRSTGILLSITSLPSKYGIGCFSESAYKFIDWLCEAGQSYWQILPLGPTGFGDSPYQSFSTFAGNPYFISLEAFISAGYLSEEECRATDFSSNIESVDYGKLYHNRLRLLKKAYQSSNIKDDPSFIEFCNNNDWLSDYSLFMALKNYFHDITWTEWETPLRLRNPETLEKYREKLANEIEFYKFLQYHFYLQWSALKKYANSHGIRIIGDLPMYVAFDSADTWANPKLFQLNENNFPQAISGCPPDGFSSNGQLWGNPLYNWDYHRETGYRWWISRLSHCFNLYDVVRIDHFRGFDEYYSIPYGAEDARNGHWEKGPGMELFHAVEMAIGKKDIIVEDLGFMTDSVRQLVNASGFPNMRVFEFAFDERDSGNGNDHLPHNYPENCVAYTGTHDNHTITSWFDTITEKERRMVRDYLCNYYSPSFELYKSIIYMLLQSKAAICIIPLQDYLGLTDESRMNTPSTIGVNWKWRVTEKQLNKELATTLRHIAEAYGRCIQK